ncbi:hypothetical protein [Streptomyces sp. CJ_13]|uniref:hypothetical protein n=1 Tax=Streptomyces sp. CJ_13 TaxID=2724943 RepID=UPI00202A4F26|nr:hypothetical protein [Streptomyces sp. CJ_13]
MITLVRMRYDDRTRDYVARRTAQGMSKKDILRCLKRFIALGVFGVIRGSGGWWTAGSCAVPSRPEEMPTNALVAVVVEVLAAQENLSTGTRSRVMRQVERLVVERHGQGVVEIPSRATFYRLIKALDEGKHAFGAATTRRSQGRRPQEPFTPTMAVRPGEVVQIDTTPLDVLAVLDDGVTGRVELSIAVDVASRTICAAVLRPAGTKAVDAALLLARALVPEPMRPGWAEALRMSASLIPHARLMSIDARLEHAAAKPVIVPDTIVIDHGRVFISDTFTAACRTLGISVQPARPATPTDKGVVERTFSSINTLFCQHVAGYVGSNVTQRPGRRSRLDAARTVRAIRGVVDRLLAESAPRRPAQSVPAEQGPVAERGLCADGDPRRSPSGLPDRR